MTGLLLAAILASVTPVWVPIVRGQSDDLKQLLAALACAVSGVLQLFLLYWTNHQTLTLNTSYSFAGVGIPLCLGALVLSRRLVGSSGAKVSACMGIVLWVLLIFLH